jgi:hypothetical protein
MANRLRLALFLAVSMACCGLLATAQTKNSCLDCHGNLPEPLGVSVETYSQNIHSIKGLTCADCHGGDATSDDPEKAMSRAAGGRVRSSASKFRSSAPRVTPMQNA